MAAEGVIKDLKRKDAPAQPQDLQKEEIRTAKIPGAGKSSPGERLSPAGFQILLMGTM